MPDPMTIWYECRQCGRVEVSDELLSIKCPECGGWGWWPSHAARLVRACTPFEVAHRTCPGENIKRFVARFLKSLKDER